MQSLGDCAAARLWKYGDLEVKQRAVIKMQFRRNIEDDAIVKYTYIHIYVCVFICIYTPKQLMKSKLQKLTT